jgi:hypothetical protein
LNCGFDFKSQKSTKEALGESENEFTIFAAAGAQAEAVSGATSSEMNFQEPLSSEAMFDSQETLVEEQDSSLEPQETYIQESGDFELDLSGMDIEDSDDWVVGATLTEDLAEISDFNSKDTLKDPTQESNEFAVQGLGFNEAEDIEQAGVETAPPEQSSSFDSEPTVLDEEMAVQEMEPYGSKSEIKLVPEDEVPIDDSGDISLETELELETKDSELSLDQEDTKSGETSQIPLDLQNNSIELEPMLELEDLDLNLEIESPEDENAPQGTQPSDATLENQSLKEDTVDKNAPLPPKDNPNQI